MKEYVRKGSLRLLSEGLRKGYFSAEELTRAYLDGIAETDGDIGAYVTVSEESALRAAREVDRRRREGEELSALAGIPFGAKDNISVRGERMTCGSRMLESYVSPYDATVIERLRASGAILLGKHNMDEFAMGNATDTSAFGLTRNPLDLTRTAGGSSGGSAASVAARTAAFALGSDTGGSVRLPAVHCGAVGIKPTYGTVSRYGLVSFAPSLDVIAPIAADVRSSALVLSAITGRDERDLTSRDGGADALSSLDKGVKGLRIGIDSALIESVSEDVRAAILSAARRLEEAGARLVSVKLPDVNALVAAYYVICSAEASSNLARFDGVRYGRRATGARSIDELMTKSRSEGFGEEVKRRIMLGAYFLSREGREAYYKRALSAAACAKEQLRETFRLADAVLTPVSASAARRLEDRRDNALDVYKEDAYTVCANVTGLPALALPYGRDRDGMPVGLGLMGREFSEALLYRIAYALEEGGNEA